MSRLNLHSTSRAEDAGFLAMRDIATVAEDTELEYRIVGGQMVRLHVALAGVAEPTVRVTLDADLGVAAASARNPALVPRLESLGYTRPGASNRFIRTTEEGLNLSNQQYGDITLDEIPGLSLALARPSEPIHLTVTGLDGTPVSFAVHIPDITSALCLKALSWSNRHAAKDAVDIWRLLRAHRQRIPESITWRQSGVQGDAAAILRSDFARPTGRGVRAASTERADQEEIRALTLTLLRE